MDNTPLKLLKPKGYLPFPSTLLPGKAGDTFCVEAKGHGMSPDIKSGDLLMCTASDSYINGDIVVIHNGKDLYCKYIIKTKNQIIFQNALKEISELDGFVIVGKVVSKYVVFE